MFSTRILGAGKRRRHITGAGGKKAFCDQEFKTKGNCEFQVRFLFVAVCAFGTRGNAVGKDVLPIKVLMEERREKYTVARNFKREKIARLVGAPVHYDIYGCCY